MCTVIGGTMGLIGGLSEAGMRYGFSILSFLIKCKAFLIMEENIYGVELDVRNNLPATTPATTEDHSATQLQREKENVQTAP
jgi:hypothetical protein